MNNESIFKEGVHYIGTPCINCESKIRYISNKRCVLCAKKWREDNKEYLKAYSKNYGKQNYQNNKEKRLIRKRQTAIERKKENPGIYFVSDPCKNCGGCLRYVSNTKCILCEKEYQKQYRQNLSKLKKQCIPSIKESNNPNNIYYNGHPCKNCGSCIRYLSNKGCVSCQKVKDRKYRQNNPEKGKAQRHRRRALKLNAEGSFTAQEWIDLCNQYGNKCLVLGCENTDLAADHIVPLAEGGTNYIDNIQPLCKSCNSSKGTKTIDYRQIYCQNCTIN